MKKSLLALAALTAFAGAASAQSSVTLFGIIDLSMRQVDNGSAGKLRTLSTDGNASSRLGLRGIEDLGGGMQAGFWIEGSLAPDVGGGSKAPPSNPTGLAPNTINGGGANGMDWQRRATVSVIGGFGEVRLGRDYTPTFGNFSAFDPAGYVGVFSSSNVRSNLVGTTVGGVNTYVRANNMVSYFLPSLGGLYGQFSVAAGENAAVNKYVGARVGYAAGPLNVAGAYGKTYKTSGSNGAQTAAVAMLDDLKQWNIGASFNAGFMTVQGLYENSTYSTANQKYGLLAVLVPLGGGTLKLSAIKTTGNSLTTVDGTKANEYGVSYVYDLSKRSALYGQMGRISNSNGARFTASSGGNPAAGSATTTAMKLGETSTGLEFGIRHIF